MSPLQSAETKPKFRFNPFVRDVVGSALDDAKADVPGINHQAFERVLESIDHVTMRRESTSLLLFGDPGSGKTHLLSRLREHLERNTGAGDPVVMVAMRMQTSASMIWRFTLRNLADALLRRRDGERSLVERLLSGRPQQIDAMHDRDLAIVLKNLLKGTHAGECSFWLRGYPLPEAALVELGLSTQPVDEEYQEERAYQVIRDLSQVVEPSPLIFCLDQVEALQKHADDQEGIFALGKLVATLHDTLHNAAIICCVQTSFIDQIKNAIRGSEQDRMLSNRAGLKELTWEQALEMISARLGTQPEIARARPAGADGLWPIEATRLKPIFEPGGSCVARRVLHRCKEIFDEAMEHGAPAIEPLDDYLSRLFEERCRVRPPEESDFILRDALPALLEILGLPRRRSGAAPRLGGFDLIVEQGGRGAALAVCNQRPGTGLVNRFRKLGERWDQAAVPRLMLLRDARLGIRPSARASQQRLEELRSRQAELIHVSPEALAALEALRSLLADADSGDLSYRGEAVSRRSVEEWLRTHMPEPLAELIDQAKTAGGRGAGMQLVSALTAILSERKIASVEDMARELKVGVKEVADCARQNPVQFAVLKGRTPVLFQPVRQFPGT